MNLEFAIVNGTLVTESSLVPSANIHIKNGKVNKISGFPVRSGSCKKRLITNTAK
jgi:hypothetical protein